MSAVTGAEFLRKLKAYAAKNKRAVRVDAKRGKGSHATVYLDSSKTVLQYPKRELKSGALSGMLKQLGLTKEDLT